MKPIWLLMMKWTEPPVRWPLRPDRPKHSAIDALAGEGRVAVDQQRQDVRAGRSTSSQLILLGAHLAEHDRIDDFEMRRIGGQRQMHLVAVEFAVRRGAEMVFDVARALDLVRA